MSISVREKPPLRTTHDIRTPNGRHYRWAGDDPDAANVPSGVRYSDAMPGGFENADATLPRKPGIGSPDLERLSTWTIYGAGAEPVWQGRLERAPGTSGSQMTVSPSAVGYQAALDDDKSVRMIPVDIDLSHWQGAPMQRRLALSATYGATDPSTAADVSGVLRTAVSGPWTAAPGLPDCEAWYDGGGVDLGSLFFAWRKGANVNAADTNWSWRGLLATDDAALSLDLSPELRAAGPGLSSLTATAPRKFAALLLAYAIAGGVANVEYGIDWTALAVYGDHGLPLYGVPSATTAPGVLASDVVAYAVARWCPQLKVTKGYNGTVKPGGYVISHLPFREATTVSEIVRQSSRFELPFWGVWEGPEFHWDPSRQPRKRWRARLSPSQLEETGPQADRLYESVVVQYQDVDQSTKSVGPPGSGADFEDAALKDPDPENPANKLGITRRALLTIGTGVAKDAIQVGRYFLQEQKQLDSSGRAQIVGYVEDDRGVLFPYNAVRSGDELAIIDAKDSSYRRIVHSEKDESSRTCSVDLDAPPEGLQALLERQGASLVRFGF